MNAFSGYCSNAALYELAGVTHAFMSLLAVLRCKASAPGLVAMYINVSLAIFSEAVRASVHAASVAAGGLLAAVKKFGTNSCNWRAAFSPTAILSLIHI